MILALYLIFVRMSKGPSVNGLEQKHDMLNEPIRIIDAFAEFPKNLL